VFCTTALFTWKLDATPLGATASILDRARTATE
jgi:hypothetical protein